MPIYEFHCKTCGARFKKILNFAQAVQIQECPHCHSQDTEKQTAELALANGSRSFIDSGGGCDTDEHFT